MAIRRLRRSWRTSKSTLLTLSVTMLVLVLVLRGIPWWLSYGDVPSKTNIAVVLNDNASVLQSAADYLKADPRRRLWLYTPRPSRAARMRAIEDRSQRYRSDLLFRGVDVHQLVIEPTQAKTPHQWFRKINAMIQPSTSQVKVFCDSLDGRYWRNVIDQSLDHPAAHRFKIRSVSTPMFSPSRWFMSRHAGKVVLSSILRYAFVKLIGESQTIDDDRYDSLLDGHGH